MFQGINWALAQAVKVGLGLGLLMNHIVVK